MSFKIYVGIDVSKLTLDVYIRGLDLHKQFRNDLNGFDSILKWMVKHIATPLDSVLICFEHTGLYSLPLAIFLEENHIHFAMISALEIKRSLGIARGKNDYVDSKRISEFAYRFQDKISVTKLPARDIAKINSLLNLRGRLSTALGGYTVSRNESMKFMGKDDTNELMAVYDHMILTIKLQIKSLENTIKEIIRSNDELRRSYDLITSIKGIGLVVGCHLIAYTHNFTRFENWRKFACYSGIAPFDHSSGTSVRGRSQVSSIANKQVKRMLHLAAICAIHTDTELQAYYVRRQSEGKNKMTIINIVRNKLLARVFAIVKRGTPYVDMRKYAA